MTVEWGPKRPQPVSDGDAMTQGGQGTGQAQGQQCVGATGSDGHGRDRELSRLASSPAPTRDAVTFLMSQQC